MSTARTYEHSSVCLPCFASLILVFHVASAGEAQSEAQPPRLSRRWKRGMLPKECKVPESAEEERKEEMEEEEESEEDQHSKAMASGPSRSLGLLDRIRLKQKLQQSTESAADVKEDAENDGFSKSEQAIPAMLNQPSQSDFEEIEEIEATLAHEAPFEFNEVGMSEKSLAASQISQESDARASSARLPTDETLKPELMTDEELGEWMHFFGLKPSSSREFRIRRLNDIVDYLLSSAPASLRSVREAPTPHRPKRHKDNETSGARTPKKAKAAETPGSIHSASPMSASPVFSLALSRDKDFEEITDAIA